MTATTTPQQTTGIGQSWVPGPCSEPSSSLTCQHVLSPPVQTLGEQGDEKALCYTNNSSPAWHCAFSPDGLYLAACFGAPDPCIRIWNKRMIVSAPVHPPTSIGPVASRHTDETEEEWILEATLSGVHTRTIRYIDFAPVPLPLLMLASASFDGTVGIWEYNAKEGNARTQNGDKSNLWECTAQLEGHDNEVKCVKWNRAGSLLATSGRDKTVWIWEAFLPNCVGGSGAMTSGGGADFECLAVLSGHEGDVKCVTFADSHGEFGEGDELLLSASYDDTIKVWVEDAEDWYCAATIGSVHTNTIWSLATSPSSQRLVSASADGGLALYKAYSSAEKKAMDSCDFDGNGEWKCVGKLPDAHQYDHGENTSNNNASTTIYSVDYANAAAGHGCIASAGSDGCIQIYREAAASTSDEPLFSRDAVAVATANALDVNSVAWHPTRGSVLSSAQDDGTVRLWKYKV